MKVGMPYRHRPVTASQNPSQSEGSCSGEEPSSVEDCSSHALFPNSELVFDVATACFYPGNFADFALSPCAGEVGGDIVSPTTSPPPISTAVSREPTFTLDLAFSSFLKRIKRRDSCTSNILIFFSIFLSWFSILRIRLNKRILFHIRTAATTNAPIASALYSTIIRRQSARSTISHNLSYIMRAPIGLDRKFLAY